MGRPAVDITGQKFGLLKAIRPTEQRGSDKSVVWEFECKCGNKKLLPLKSIRGKNAVKSCGCLGYSHSQTGTRLYKIWDNMKARCFNPNSTEYERYGGRGIIVCSEWLGENGFENFRDWALQNGYNDTLTIDRIELDKDYSPSNCKWSTYEEQLNNTSRNRLLTYNGKTQTMAQWSKELGIGYNTLNTRINTMKLSVKEAFERPVAKRI